MHSLTTAGAPAAQLFRLMGAGASGEATFVCARANLLSGMLCASPAQRVCTEQPHHDQAGASAHALRPPPSPGKFVCPPNHPLGIRREYMAGPPSLKHMPSHARQQRPQGPQGPDVPAWPPQPSTHAAAPWSGGFRVPHTPPRGLRPRHPPSLPPSRKRAAAPLVPFLHATHSRANCHARAGNFTTLHAHPTSPTHPHARPRSTPRALGSGSARRSGAGRRAGRRVRPRRRSRGRGRRQQREEGGYDVALLGHVQVVRGHGVVVAPTHRSHQVLLSGGDLRARAFVRARSARVLWSRGMCVGGRPTVDG